MSRALPAVLALLATWFAVGAAVRAQEHVVVHAVDERELVTVRVASFPGTPVAGGFGFALVVAENHDAQAHLVRIDIASRTWGSSNLGVRRDLLLGPHELARCHLPLPTTEDARLALDVLVDGVSHPGEIVIGRRSDVGLLVSHRTGREPWATASLQALQGGVKMPSDVLLVAPDDLPADWRLFTGFRAVFVDGRAPVGSAVQAALVQFATSGGAVVVGEPDRLPAGALRERCGTADADGRVRCGLGNCVVVPVGDDSDVLYQRLAALPSVATVVWPAGDDLLRAQQVPGLGEVPVLVFLAVILVFAFVVGPLNFVLLRRWRRPLLVLVTVPVCGLGTTLLMLGFALVHDGFGVRGVVRSWTLLDQERHEATSLAARTLFAGVAPDALAMAPDGLLIAPLAAAREDRRSADRWQFDPVANVVDGGALPSRQVTPLLSARQGLARQRLRVRVAGDRLELLTDGGVVPVGEVLLRDPDGRLWLGTAPWLLPVDEQESARALDRWMRAAAELTRADTDGGANGQVHGLIERLLGGRDLPRGSYVLRVADAPWLDDHGLQVAYDRAEHFVVGRLAAEDLLR